MLPLLLQRASFVCWARTCWLLQAHGLLDQNAMLAEESCITVHVRVCCTAGGPRLVEPSVHHADANLLFTCWTELFWFVERLSAPMLQITSVQNWWDVLVALTPVINRTCCWLLELKIALGPQLKSMLLSSVPLVWCLLAPECWLSSTLDCWSRCPSHLFHALS